MTLQSISSRWIRDGLAVAAIVAALLAFLLLPSVTRGQEGQQGSPDGQSLDPGGVISEVGEVPADLNASPYVVGADAFIPTGNNTDGRYYNGWYGFLDRLNAGDYGYVCYVAPVYLEDGVTIKNYEMYGVDNDGNYIRSYLYRKQYNYGAGAVDKAPEAIGGLNSVGQSTNVVKWTSGSINSVVDNSTYHYYIESCPYSPAHQVYSYRVNWSQ